MSETPFVAINVLTVPEDRREVLEERFANRAREVESMAGFRHFELLRPVSGTDTYLVYTRWDSREHFDAWVSSMQFERGHAGTDTGDGDGEGRPAPAATGSQVWSFEAVQIADVPSDG